MLERSAKVRQEKHLLQFLVTQDKGFQVRQAGDRLWEFLHQVVWQSRLLLGSCFWHKQCHDCKLREHCTTGVISITTSCFKGFVTYHLQQFLLKTCSCQLTPEAFPDSFHSHPIVSTAVKEAIWLDTDDDNKPYWSLPLNIPAYISKMNCDWCKTYQCNAMLILYIEEVSKSGGQWLQVVARYW